MQTLINGIQQIGIGVTDAEAAFNWYKKIFGTDVIIFKDAATATLMRQYTGDTAHERFAILAMNLQGGGGFEIWQYTSRTPQPAVFESKLGYTGVFIVKIRCKDIAATVTYYNENAVNILTRPAKNPEGKNHFYIKDLWDNIFELIEDAYWFTNESKLTGAVCGVVIGVTNMEQSLSFYKTILGFDEVLFSGADVFSDWQGVPGSQEQCNRVIIGKQWQSTGAFGKLLGPIQIELVAIQNNDVPKIYENRYWGDLGFIHVCFDVNRMEAHEINCAKNKYPLTVNSCNGFDMGEAAGHFAYNEDPDGTLIEYVETHKVPIAKKYGLYLNLKKRNPEKPLPNWVVKCLRFGRVK
jgi:catechol 2,3-dioxygenase-like lactoylglutathione lyase family enzyme